jgi:hypothetical protein
MVLVEITSSNDPNFSRGHWRNTWYLKRKKGLGLGMRMRHQKQTDTEDGHGLAILSLPLFSFN